MAGQGLPPRHLELGVARCLVAFVHCVLEDFQVCACRCMGVVCVSGGRRARVHQAGVDHVLLDGGYSLIVIVCVAVCCDVLPFAWGIVGGFVPNEVTFSPIVGLMWLS